MFLAYKLLCIAAATLGLHVSSTSPNPPLSAEERLTKPTKLENVLGSWYLRTAQTAMFWFIGFAEILATVAATPEFPHTLVVATPSRSTLFSMTIGASLIAIGALLRLWCYRELGRQFTFEIGLLKDHELITTGPYSLVRHPSYTGALLAYTGLLVYYASPGSWAMESFIRGSIAGTVFSVFYGCFVVFAMAGLVLRIPKEDSGLQGKFGAEWERWAQNTYALVPGWY
ncbi:hypothetical protein HMN09_00282200 [Mycena chlorophos]|uniref:Protein-S-isoprenylcysteine O-methyltransferase n=1 Tax=Mycena chlorophos TaxID=658473 RepID=A0A8H6TMI9_MYCCL|nr:hypothetical protein HMN09_00282200 [Mycena chlorophos]